MKKSPIPASVCLILWLVVLLPASLEGADADTQPRSRPADEIVPRNCLVIGPVGRYGRSPVHTDAIEAQIVAGRWLAPKAGETVKLPGGSSRTWEKAAAAKDGWFKHPALRGGYAYFSVEAERQKVMILAASGHGMVYVNGQPRTGDPYRYGYVRLPIMLKKGRNDLLFHCGRGRLKVKLTAPISPLMLNTDDATLPDLILGEKVQTLAAVVVINATANALEGEVFITTCLGDAEPTHWSVGSIPRRGVRKVGFPVVGPAPAAEGTCKLKLKLMRRDPRRAYAKRVTLLDEAVVELRIRRPDQIRKRTFRSRIDGSVQYYAVNPARPTAKDAPPPALFLTLHGASCKAIGQVGCYAPKTWGHVVAPTNRRPFGFDWEDWGRIDAMEVLDIAQKRLRTDRRRTYLTGHSMGGHGVWHIGAIYPDRFAAIGPSAAWISFWTYGGAAQYKNPTPIEQMLWRAAAPSRTRTLLPNCAHHGVYILHGSKDNQVPVTHARHMVGQLARFHRDFVYHEQPDVKHWWNISKEPGTDCVDWPAMFEFFARHTVPPADSVRQVNFITVNPAISCRSHWVCISAQIQHLKPSSVSIRFDGDKRRFAGTTKNVARLSLHLGHVKPGKPISVELDGQKIEGIPYHKPKTEGIIRFTRQDGKWSRMPSGSGALKCPDRYGPFKEAFRNRVMFVYGTKGTPEENAWALAKARYDAETFWYRGNGSIDVIPDVDFDASVRPDRNVILYGNADTNAAWKVLLADSPVQVRRGLVRIGQRELTGENLACLFIRPRPAVNVSIVGMVGGSGLAGMRLTDRLPYFVSGVAYPDCIVIAPEALTSGTGGVLAAGFFGLDWSVASGQFAWAKQVRQPDSAPKHTSKEAKK